MVRLHRHPLVVVVVHAHHLTAGVVAEGVHHVLLHLRDFLALDRRVVLHRGVDHLHPGAVEEHLPDRHLRRIEAAVELEEDHDLLPHLHVVVRFRTVQSAVVQMTRARYARQRGGEVALDRGKLNIDKIYIRAE